MKSHRRRVELVAFFLLISLGLMSCNHLMSPNVLKTPGKQTRSADKAIFDCADVAPTMITPLGTTIRLPNESDNKLYSPGATVCDARNMILATRRAKKGVLQFRNIYGSKRTISPSDAIRPVVSGLVARASKVEGNQPFKILIFAHGGLVNHAGAVESAQSLAPGMVKDGFAPVFLVWNSDFGTAYLDRLCCVRDGERDKSGYGYFFPVRTLADIGSSVPKSLEHFGRQAVRWHKGGPTRKPDSIYHIGVKRDWLDWNIPGTGSDGKPSYENDAPSTRLANLDEREWICLSLSQIECPTIVYPPKGIRQNPTSKCCGPSLRFATGLPGSVVSTALASEVGAKSWDDMVRRTRLGFQSPTTLLKIPTKTGCEAPDPVDSRVGAYAIFFDRMVCELSLCPEAKGLEDPLKPCIFRDKAGRAIPRERIELHFYGHSMGALVANEALGQYPDLPWKKVVYMAAANSIRDFRLMAGPVIAEKQIKTYSLMLHPLNETREIEAFGMVPQGSLLEWIDEMFEGPRSLDDKTMGKWVNIQKVMYLLPPKLRQQMTFRVFPRQVSFGLGLSGDESSKSSSLVELDCVGANEYGKSFVRNRRSVTRCHPISHGDFTNYSFWRDAYLESGDNIVVRSGPISSNEASYQPQADRSQSNPP